MENQGWIKLFRQLKNTSWYKKSTVVHLFIHLLLSANHETKKMYWNGGEIEIKEGQIVTGLYKLSEETGISIQSLRTALTVLKSTSTITIKSTNRFSLITISKWQEFQGCLTSKSTSKLTNNQQTTNKQLTTNNNDKNDKNEKKEREIHAENYHKSITYLIEEELLKRDYLNKKFSVYNVSFIDVKRKAQELYNYCQAKGKRYKDYRAFLKNALVKDFGYKFRQ